MTIPAALLTQASLTYVADRTYRQFLVEHRNPKLPEVKPVMEDPTGAVLWDYLLETDTLPSALENRAMYSNQPRNVERWFVLDAIWSAVANNMWTGNQFRGDRMPEARRLLGVLLSPIYENRTPFTDSHAVVNNARYGCQEGYQLMKLAEHFYIQQLTVFGHACAAGCAERPYDKTIMAYEAMSGRTRASQARRRLNLILQLHENLIRAGHCGSNLPDPYDVAVAQGLF